MDVRLKDGVILALFHAFVALILVLLASESFAVDVEEQLNSPRLYWRNGDTLDGSIVSAGHDELSWASKIFAAPLRLRRAALHMIRFPTQPQALLAQQDSSEAQTIETRDGNRFFGFVKDSTGDTLIVDTHQHGEVRIRRDAVSLIANPVQRAHVYSGPKGLRGWSTLTYGRKLSEWEELSGGRLTTKMVAAELYRSLPASSSVDVDIELIWRNNPSFQVRFLTPYAKTTKETVKLETRASGYVIQTLGSNGRFRQLDSIPKETTKCRLLLRWNHSASELAVYRGRRYLGKISVDRQAQLGTAGIYVKNTGPQLTVSRLEIRARSKLNIALTDPTKDTVLRADNQSLAGRVTRITGDSVTIIDSEENSLDLPWSEIPEISFRHQGREPESSSADTECIFHNGETLKGLLLRADDQAVEIEVSAMEGPIRCRYDGMERVIFNPKSVPPAENLPRLVAGEAAIHGQMAPTETGHVGWLPIGGIEPVRTATDVDVRLELKRVIPNSGSPDEDLVYLCSGDVIPGTVHSAASHQLTLSSRFADKRVLSVRTIKAVELSATPVKPIRGFDRHWEVKDPVAASIDKDRILFAAPTSLKHPGVLKGCDQIEFVVTRDLDKKQGAFLHVTLDGEEDLRRTVPFYFSGDQSFVMGRGGTAFQLIPGDNDRFSVMIQTRYPYSVTVNGVEVDQTQWSAKAERQIAPFVSLSFAVTQGQTLLKRRREAIAGDAALLAISDLVVSQTRRPAISDATASLDSKPLLTVPRNRESHSITHLAIGTNNDIIRGRLLHLDEKTVRLESRETTLEIPRDNLSGLVWLEHDRDDAAVALFDTRVVLRDATTFGLERPTLGERHLQGHHPQLGACRIAVDEIHVVLCGNAQNRLQNYEFLGWTPSSAVQPKFATEQNGRHRVESDLLGKRLELEVELIDSSRFLLSQQTGRVVVIEFWASWCAPCVKNMPKLIETMRAYEPSQASFVAVNEGESPITVATMVAAKGWDMATGLDPDSRASKTFQIESLPQTVVIDHKGRVAAVFVGATSNLQAELKATVDRLLEE